MLEKAGVRTMLNELSSTVVFERPREEAFVRKWQLACQGDIAHVVVMPNITLDKLEVRSVLISGSLESNCSACCVFLIRSESDRVLLHYVLL